MRPTQHYAIQRAHRDLRHYYDFSTSPKLSVAESLYSDLMEREAILEVWDSVPVDDRSEYLSGSARQAHLLDEGYRAGERPWTDARKLGLTGQRGGYNYLGTATVVLVDGTMYTQLAPSSGLAVRGHDGPKGTRVGGSWKVRKTLGGRLVGGHAGQRKRTPARPRRRKYASNAERQAAYRRRKRVTELVERYGYNADALADVSYRKLGELIKAERNAALANARVPDQKVAKAIAEPSDRGW